MVVGLGSLKRLNLQVHQFCEGLCSILFWPIPENKSEATKLIQEAFADLAGLRISKPESLVVTFVEENFHALNEISYRLTSNDIAPLVHELRTQLLESARTVTS